MLLIDNYDSFTFNLYQLLGEVTGEPPVVVRNDDPAVAQRVREGCDGVVVSPGPGRPSRPADVGCCLDVIRGATVPVLAVCLGHQAIAEAFGGRVGYAPEPMHGRTSKVHHTGRGLFAGIPSSFSAVRYHSLCVTDLPDELEALAWAEDGVVMALRHRDRPLWGVQFHPESICTEYGRAMVENFVSLTGLQPAGPLSPGGTRPAHRPEPAYRLHVRKLGAEVDAEQAFRSLFAASEHAFWLDSAAAAGEARWSYLGDASGPLAEVATYDVVRGEVSVTSGGVTTRQRVPFFDWLEETLRERHVDQQDRPFDFELGYVGYLGYELKAECGGDAGYRAATPDAALLFADRMVAVDHQTGAAYLAALSEPGGDAHAEAWLEATAARLVAPGRDVDPLPEFAGRTPVPRFRHDADAYLRLIERCRGELADGESYEICLTNAATIEADLDPLAVYLELRRVNPAPFAAYQRFGDVAVCSSSPERFLRVDAEGGVQAKPIKGTRRRGCRAEDDEALRDELANSEKDLAENLMITDLVRNDLGSVCRLGSVGVPEMFAVESYATVHQLVSTVTGRLRADRSAVDCVRAAFPGGSMTGAPKRRTMQIIDRLEQGPRGVYSGALGYFSLGGAVDLSIVIRTIVATPGELSFGVGGAVVALSDPRAELEETMVKAEPLLEAIRRAATHAPA